MMAKFVNKVFFSMTAASMTSYRRELLDQLLPDSYCSEISTTLFSSSSKVKRTW